MVNDHWSLNSHKLIKYAYSTIFPHRPSYPLYLILLSSGRGLSDNLFSILKLSTLTFIAALLLRFLEKNKNEILMIRIVNYKADDETQRILLAQAILQLIKDTIGIR